jgi:hypothetical protein
MCRVAGAGYKASLFARLLTAIPPLQTLSLRIHAISELGA